MGSRLQDVIMRDTRANQPLATAVSAGTLYYVTDEGITERSNGTTWQSFSDSGVVAQFIISAGTLTGSRSSLVFSNSNGISFGMAGSTITGQHNGLTNVKISAGTTSNNLSSLVFSNSNNVSFGLNGSTVTATVTIATSLTNINVSAGTTSNNLSVLVFSNNGNVSFGLDGSTVTATVTVASTQGSIKVSASGSSASVSALTFANSNSITFGLSDGTITASFSAAGGGGGGTWNYFQNVAYAADMRSAVPNNRIWVVPFQLAAALSANYLRYPISNLSVQNRTFGAVSAATSWSAQQELTFHNQVFTKGTGVSSGSILSLSNYSAGLTVRTAFSNGASNEWTASLLITYPFETGVSNFTSSYACTSASYVINTAGLTNAINGLRFMEVPFNTSLPASAYWMGFAISTTTTNNGGATGLSTTNFQFAFGAISMTTANISRIGTGVGDLGYFQGLGAITTNAQIQSTTGIDTTLIKADAAGVGAIIPFAIL